MLPQPIALEHTLPSLNAPLNVPSWMYGRFESLEKRLCHSPPALPWPGIRGTQVKPSVRMKKTQESSK
jgi:hypothetical protein